LVNDRWHSIADKIRATDSSLTLGQKLCAVAVEVLGANAASIALVVNHAYSAISASSDVATLLDEEQFALGNGPTFDAQEASGPVIIDDTTAHRASHKWPAFTPVAAKHGIHGVFAFPLRVGTAYLGVLTAYRTNPGKPTADEFSDGLILASLATAELVRHQAGVTSPELADIFEPGLYDQSALQIAAGMVAEALECPIVAALVRIRARAFADDKPVSEIARAIVAREIVLEK
jgi:transcriptional regulator with GAF, ATPase, and Fis domain